MKLQPILRGIRNADRDYKLIEPDDSIAVALSGGKDSMVLFLALSMYQKFQGQDFKLYGIHVDVGFEEFEHETMKNFAKEHNLELYIQKTQIYDILKKKTNNSGKIQCSLCSQFKKGVIFDKARELGCNKIALGHHGDDAIETLFLNMIHGSKIATFLPKQYMSRMDMTMIRPLVYLREKDIIRACERNNIPAVKRVCPNDGFTQREDIKQKLYKFYEEYPEAEDNFLRALYNEKQVSLWQKEDTI